MVYLTLTDTEPEYTLHSFFTPSKISKHNLGMIYDDSQLGILLVPLRLFDDGVTPSSLASDAF